MSPILRRNRPGRIIRPTDPRDLGGGACGGEGLAGLGEVPVGEFAVAGGVAEPFGGRGAVVLRVAFAEELREGFDIHGGGVQRV